MRALVGQRLAVERAEFEAGRARRQFDACEPEHRLVARTLERRLEKPLLLFERERGKLADPQAARAGAADRRRNARARPARSRPPAALERADDHRRDRKELLRTLVSDVSSPSMRPIDAPTGDSAGKAAPGPSWVRLNARGPERRRTPEDTDRADPPARRAITPTSRPPRSWPAKVAGPAPACRSPRAASAPPGKRRIPVAPPPTRRSNSSRSTRPPRARRRTRTIRRWLAKACSPANRPRRPRPGGSASPTKSARVRARLPDGYLRSTKPPARSASPARPCCTRSNAANSTPSMSPAAAAKASPSTFPNQLWTDCSLPEHRGAL